MLLNGATDVLISDAFEGEACVAQYAATADLGVDSGFVLPTDTLSTLKAEILAMFGTRLWLAFLRR